MITPRGMIPQEDTLRVIGLKTSGYSTAVRVTAAQHMPDDFLNEIKTVEFNCHINYAPRLGDHISVAIYRLPE